jgi:mono/diheme cytochrome c family protein
MLKSARIAASALLALGIVTFARGQQQLGANAQAAAPQPNVQQAAPANSGPPIDQAAAARGQQLFAQNCSFCHGPDARGGAEGGADLTHSAIVVGDTTATQLAAFLKTGRPPRMPAFSNLTDEQVADIESFVRTQVPAAGGRGALSVVVVGDATAGKAFFNGAGKCNTCHSLTGDLQGIGAKYDVLTLQGRIVLPRGSGGWPGLKNPFEVSNPPNVPRSVTVIEPDGKVTTGELVSISDFDVVLRDSNNVRHTFARNGDVPKVTLKDPLQAHVDLMPHLTDEEMHDLTAYLVTLK